jgi:putative cell wall-binding protein
MTNTEILTLIKAGYVVVAAEGQTQENLYRLSDIFIPPFINVTAKNIQEGQAMSMKTMVENLTKFTTPHSEANIIVGTMIGVFKGVKSNKLANEINTVLQTKKYSKYEMPELAARIKTESSWF